MSASDFGRDLRIISGGQTGVDQPRWMLRSACTSITAAGVPKVSATEDGVIADRYQLRKTTRAIMRSERGVMLPMRMAR